MKRLAMMAGTIGLLAIAATPATAASAAPQAAQTPSCTSGYGHIQNYGLGGYAFYNSSTNRVINKASGSSITNWCMDSVNGGTAFEIQQADTSECITYGGAKAGPGYFTEATCANKTTQEFQAWDGSGDKTALVNLYAGDGQNRNLNSPGIGDNLNVSGGDPDSNLTEFWNILAWA